MGGRTTSSSNRRPWNLEALSTRRRRPVYLYVERTTALKPLGNGSIRSPVRQNATFRRSRNLDDHLYASPGVLQRAACGGGGGVSAVVFSLCCERGPVVYPTHATSCKGKFENRAIARETSKRTERGTGCG